jgi:hypothetical protein
LDEVEKEHLMESENEKVIARWLLDDPALRPEAVQQAQGDEFQWGDDDLAVWVNDLLYDTAYDAPALGLRGHAADLHWVMDLGGDVEAARRVRGQVPLDALLGCDWSVVREALFAEAAAGDV